VKTVIPSDDLDVVFRRRCGVECVDHVFEGCNDVKVCFNASFRSQKERKRGVGKRRKEARSVNVPNVAITLLPLCICGVYCGSK
jgi:hypothetical protein